MNSSLQAVKLRNNGCIIPQLVWKIWGCVNSSKHKCLVLICYAIVWKCSEQYFSHHLVTLKILFLTLMYKLSIALWSNFKNVGRKMLRHVWQSILRKTPPFLECPLGVKCGTSTTSQISKPPNSCLFVLLWANILTANPNQYGQMFQLFRDWSKHIKEGLKALSPDSYWTYIYCTSGHTDLKFR